MNPAPLKLAGRPWENEDDLLSHVGQLRSIARQLWRIAEGFTKSLENEAAASLDDAVPDRKKNDGDPAPDSEQLSRLARNAYKDRRRRDRLFGPDLFAEPAWDMLLDLLASRSEGVISGPENFFWHRWSQQRLPCAGSASWRTPVSSVAGLRLSTSVLIMSI
jgi:hypothetical protein